MGFCLGCFWNQGQVGKAMDEVTNRKRGVIGLSFLQAKRSKVKRREKMATRHIKSSRTWRLEPEREVQLFSLKLLNSCISNVKTTCFFHLSNLKFSDLRVWVDRVYTADCTNHRKWTRSSCFQIKIVLWSSKQDKTKHYYHGGHMSLTIRNNSGI